MLDRIPPDVLRLAGALPRFPDGRIDYTHASAAPVLNIFILCQGKLLLVKRGGEVGWLKDRWHVVAGFLDEEKTLAQKALEEVLEETGIAEDQVARIIAQEPLHVAGSKEWIIYPVVIELAGQPEITLDWEHVEYAWVEKHDLGSYDLLPEVLQVANTL